MIPPASKIRNKLVKIKNGNINKSIKSIHWNLGSRFWDNKSEDIQYLVDEIKPDLAFISEANLFSGLANHMRIIDGYSIVYTSAINTLGYSRLVLIVREGFQVTLKKDWMEDQVASIWVQIKNRGCKGITICGIYREHKLLLQA